MDALRQLRAEKHQQYLQLKAEDKPHAEVCPDCGETIVKSVSLCPSTGQYHHPERLHTMGSVIVDGNIMTSEMTRQVVASKTVKWEAAYTQKVRADASSLNIFQSFIQQREGKLQRFGYLYGKYDPVAREVEVHAIYEPEQTGTPFSFEEQPDPFLPKADRVATLLGLRRVGAICSHPPRDPNVIQLNSRELLLIAREQCKYGKECVLLTVSPNYSTGVMECHAWQSSSLCLSYYRLAQLHENTKPKEVVERETRTENKNILNAGERKSSSAASSPLQTKSSSTGNNNNNKVEVDVDLPEEVAASQHLQETEIAKYVFCDTRLEIAEEKTDAFNGKTKYVSEEPSHLVDTRWFTSYIAVEQFSSPLVSNLFVRRNRPGMEPPTFENLDAYFNDPKRKNKSFVEKIADFHVLLFLADVFSIEDDIPLMVEGIRLGHTSPEIQNYELIINAYLPSSVQ